MNIHQILKEYWGHSNFRPLQEDIIAAVLNGKDTLALMPTGGGKSICFQVPAMVKEGLCLVISPLIALMKDQVDNLKKKSITAFAIYSGMSRKEVINILKLATSSNCKFLYVSPERLETTLFKEYLPALDVNLIAVDEAHCISQWGYDFRPPYLRIAALREELPGVPILALTASATPAVQKDICEKLLFKDPSIFSRSFERPNLSYSVFTVDSKINKITEILQKVKGSSIVYCKSRKRTKEISDLLNMHGITADFYHAGLQQEERMRKQASWINNTVRTIVCTNAFGMGIDKPDVRVVIHADVPDCLENYYQEAGRAGRDEKKSYAVLLYDHKELDELLKLPGIRFPTLDNIRMVYEAMMNYLQIPGGSGEGNYYNFDFTDFVKKFRIDMYLAIYAIKALEQEGWVSYSEQIFLPSRIQFVTNKSWLYQFEIDNPKLEPVIKTLLRTYEGIFDMPVSIHEKSIAYLLRREEADVIPDLVRLHANAIIEYIPKKDSPQLYLLLNRVRAETLRFNMAAYDKRKQQFIERINKMLDYIHAGKQCRSQFIATYFGDDKTKPCSICDNCLKQKDHELSADEFNSITQSVFTIIRQQAVLSEVLPQQLPGIKKDKLYKVLDFLQSENKIYIDKGGYVKPA
ncbi:recombinase RecQ [Niastella koreensis]|uniref:ATP-dependent DNA helicase RecQ n=2 Tax=Niastella koreensis TaxID=354356 RepID=G8TP55_NIAKG|nr:ATP-dependent DNA helicase RecQ [Niastella koreensis]AEW03173.1 ATP-dependent DNA helicase, RecQ family [Niastella koreensis GR20-10]OQP55478.1 recombinase RecQ [Niastella koreensis]